MLGGCVINAQRGSSNVALQGMWLSDEYGGV